MFVLFINGPPRSGKDTFGRFLHQYTSRYSKIVKFASPLKNGVHISLGLDVAEDHFEDCKDQPNDELFGDRPRQLYIHFAENVIRERFGRDIYGRIAVRQMQQNPTDVFIFTDCGFPEEVNVVAEYAGRENCALIRIHRVGTDFKNDSRGYLEGLKIWREWNLYNFSDLKHLENDAIAIFQLLQREKKVP